MSAAWPGKPPRQRPQAAADIAAIADHLNATAGAAVALRFIDAVEAAYALLSTHPACGSPRHAHVMPELPAPLRFHPVKTFERILVYYMESPDAVEILRIWDAARGLEALLEDASE
ncbi:MAG: type II toxin-antitoxin system RelE/ParE family toxin [Lysobacter sp.]|nr:type II toxin-antitoxin system RelE/ParE family toxin [Lysobacter sp.]